MGLTSSLKCDIVALVCGAFADSVTDKAEARWFWPVACAESPQQLEVPEKEK
jgi:hypothetical protein